MLVMDCKSGTFADNFHIKAQFLNVKLVHQPIVGEASLSRWAAVTQELEKDGTNMVDALEMDLKDNWNALVKYTEEIQQEVDLQVDVNFLSEPSTRWVTAESFEDDEDSKRRIAHAKQQENSTAVADLSRSSSDFSAFGDSQDSASDTEHDQHCTDL